MLQIVFVDWLEDHIPMVLALGCWPVSRGQSWNVNIGKMRIIATPTNHLTRSIFSNEHWHFHNFGWNVVPIFSDHHHHRGTADIWLHICACFCCHKMIPAFSKIFHWRKHWSELQNFKNIKANNLVSAYICIILYSYILSPTFKDLLDMNDHGFLIVSPKLRHAPHRMAMGKWI